MSKTILVTGCSSGFGALTARALAEAGHIVYGSMRDVDGLDAEAAAEADSLVRDHGWDLRTIELDVTDENSVAVAVEAIIAAEGKIDCVVHNAGRGWMGPAEAFTPEQMAAAFDINVLGCQRLNRAVLPGMRDRHDGLLVWVGSSSTRGGTGPYLAPYFAAKAAMDSLAVSYASELTRWGIGTTIVVPGFYTGTNYAANLGQAADQEIAASYDALYDGIRAEVRAKITEAMPDDADPREVADEIVRVIAMEDGERPFRVYVDPMDDGCKEVGAVADDVRVRFYERFGIAELLRPAASA